MQTTMLRWQGREFVALSGEGGSEATAAEATRGLFGLFDEALGSVGLSLANTVRTRLWAADRESRDLGSRERVAVLSAVARSASSSYIAPGRFESNARVAIDLLALKPASGARKLLKEYEPPIVPLRYLTYDSLVFLSGVTSELETLVGQMDDILPRLQGSLADAGTGWDRAIRVSFYLHRSQSMEELSNLFRERVTADIPETDVSLVDGYSTPGKLVEIEVTAAV